ncbi:unnamed protein product [Discosporangium mesarthrocarpum]
MEGLGLGASGPENAGGVFAAIVVHKGLAAFSLGSVCMLENISKCEYFCFMGLFSLLTPLGALMGIIVRSDTTGVGEGTGAGICTALGAGTFIHVAAMEVLPRELLHDSRRKKTKLSALLLGYGIFSALSPWV